jgi:LemA protein
MLQYIVALIIVVIIVYFVATFNKFKKYSNASEANLGQIRVSMKKRFDMIEQLLGAVKGYTEYERDVFKTLAEMRAGITSAGSSQLEDIDRQSRQITSNLLAVAEAYPDLKASETVQKLMESIVSVEDEIARHRYTYNNIVQEYNTMIDTVPSNLVAMSTSSSKLSYLQFEEEIQASPEFSVD